jgi:hypothetical protein
MVLSPSLSLAPDRNVAMTLGARATRFTNDAWSLAGSGAVALRVPFSAGLGLLLSGYGEAIRTSYHATYLSGGGTPALEWRPGRFSFWGGYRLAAARTTLDQVSGVPLPRATNSSLEGPAFGTGIHGVTWSLNYREEHSRPSAVPVIDRSASLVIRRAPLTVGGSLGLRRAEDENRAFGGANLALSATPGIDLIAAVESYPSNRLTGALGGRAFTAGISLGIGGPRGPRALPKPAGVPPLTAGMTRLAYAAPEAESVDVAGDWNRWRPERLTRSRNGVWYTDLAIPAGYYRYAFRVDGTTWKVPKGVAAVDDGFGGKSAWLSVSEPGRTASQSANRKEAP